MINFKPRLVDNMPDAYYKAENSNNHKMLQIDAHAKSKIRADQQALWDTLDLQNCTGKTLELYGEMVGQPRGMATDAQYRLMILAKIARNQVKSDYDSIAHAVCMTFNCEPTEFRMEETENGGVKITKLPLDVIVSAGLTIQQTISLLSGMLPTGVMLESVDFEGSFEFSDSENDIDNTKGFATAEGHIAGDENIGGHLGYTGTDVNETVLPV